ncbi:hypothetical protein ACHAWC_007919, partial [Mediolabrus comicus]
MSDKEHIIIKGIIIGRRSLGRKLAFADVITPPQSDKSIQLIFTRQSFRGPTNDDDTFNQPFPTKDSSLPYGASIIAQLGDCQKVPSKTNSEVINDVWRVTRWRITEHPKELAEDMASLQIDSSAHKSSGTDDDDEQKEKKSQSVIIGSGAMSCSDYLKIRGEAFEMANTHKQRILDLKGDNASAQPSNGQSTRSRKIKPNTNSSQTKDNKSSFANIESEFHHGGKQAKGLRAKIFASWILEVFFDIAPTSTDKYLDNSIISQQDRLICQPCQSNNGNSSTPSEQQREQAVHVFDIAGGKGQLSLQLILQQMHCSSTLLRISRCTIVDPMVRKSDAKQRYAKLKKAVSRLRKNNNDIDGEAPTIEHMATCFTKDAFPGIYSNSISIGHVDEMSTPSHTNSLLLGLHPDEPTEDILDAALEHNLSVAIIPCCVYADLFPSRMIKRSGSDDDGKHEEVPVRNYSEFLQYLLDKDESLKLATLPFEGKNKV